MPDNAGLPSVAELLKKFEYRDGHLYRRPDTSQRPQWAGQHQRKPVGWIGGTPKRYLKTRLNGRCVGVHRIIWAMFNGAWPTQTIDHIDHNPLNNRIENLREIPFAQQNLNQSRPKNNRSGVVGVHWSKHAGKWRAEIKHRNRKIHLLVTDDFDEAVKARKAAEKQFGFHSNHGS